MVQAIYGAVGPLNALGLTSSYQNEGSAWETNWQEGEGPPHVAHPRRPHQSLIYLRLKAFFGYKYTQLQQIKQKYDPNNCTFS
jgi:hypothetical protein